MFDWVLRQFKALHETHLKGMITDIDPVSIACFSDGYAMKFTIPLIHVDLPTPVSPRIKILNTFFGPTKFGDSCEFDLGISKVFLGFTFWAVPFLARGNMGVLSTVLSKRKF